MLMLGSEPPNFRLSDTLGKWVSRDDFADSPGLLVMFICNHCPYVKHIADKLSAFAREYRGQGLAMVAINANDVRRYPQDDPVHMAHESSRRGYVFPYLYDETQAVAKAYGAACTPDFYLFDQDRRLVYHGQFDDSRPGNAVPVTGSSLRDAVDAMLSGRDIAADQKPSVGCSIKWRAEHRPISEDL